MSDVARDTLLVSELVVVVISGPHWLGTSGGVAVCRASFLFSSAGGFY